MTYRREVFNELVYIVCCGGTMIYFGRSSKAVLQCLGCDNLLTVDELVKFAYGNCLVIKDGGYVLIGSL